MVTINLRYRNNKLEVIECPFIDVPEILFTATSDVGDNIFIILKLNNTSSKTVQLVRCNESLKGKLTFTNDDVVKIKEPSIQVCDCSGIKPYYTNTIPISVDIAKIMLDIKVDTNTEIKKLKCEIKELKSIIDGLLSGGISNNIKCNLKYSKPGMVPVTVDCNGTFVLKRPFAGMVEEVNGIQAEDNKVVITSNDIYHTENRTISEVLEIQSRTLNSMFEVIQRMQESYRQLRDDYIKLQLDFNAHKSNPII